MATTQAAAVVDQRYERQIAALSAQLAAAHKEAAAQQELCRGATTRAASLDVKLGKAQKALAQKDRMVAEVFASSKKVDKQHAEIAKWFELRQQDRAAAKAACLQSKVLKKEVSDVLLHANMLSAKDHKDFIMKLRMKFHPDKNQFLTKSAQELYKALQSGLD